MIIKINMITTIINLGLVFKNLKTREWDYRIRRVFTDDGQKDEGHRLVHSLLHLNGSVNTRLFN